jgi:hypothetical protein
LAGAAPVPFWAEVRHRSPDGGPIPSAFVNTLSTG